MKSKLSDRSVQLAATIITLIIGGAFFIFGQADRAAAAGILSGFAVCVVGLKWHCRREIWFWLTVSSIVLIHALLIYKFPLASENRIDRAWFGPFAFIDFMAMVMLVHFIDQAIKAKRSNKGVNADPR